MAAKASCSSSDDVSTAIRLAGHAARSAVMVVTPSMPGMSRSTRIRLGVHWRASATACAPSPVSATTAMSSVAPSNAARPWRTIA